MTPRGAYTGLSVSRLKQWHYARRREQRRARLNETPLDRETRIFKTRTNWLFLIALMAVLFALAVTA